MLVAVYAILMTQNLFAAQQFSARVSQNEIPKKYDEAFCLSSRNDGTRDFVSRYEKDSDRGAMDYSPDELGVYFNDVYENSHRLKSRLYFDSKHQKIISDFSRNSQGLPVPDSFIKNILAHLEKALAAHYG